MATNVSFELKRFYSFDTIAPMFIGSRYTNMKLIDILSFDSAISVRQDIVSINQKIKDNVPGSVELNAANLKYLKFMDTKNQIVVLAKEWLDENSIVDLTASGGFKAVTITIKEANLEDITIINNALKNLGYYNLNIDAQDYV